MILMTEQWRKLIHPDIRDIYFISTQGRIKAKDTEPVTANYHSSNGYDYIKLVTNEGDMYCNLNMRYFPIDELVAQTFVKCPDELIGKPIRVNHKDGNNRNSYFDNLEFIEDIEDWRVIEDIRGDYEVSSFGRIRKSSTGFVYKQNFTGGYSKYPFEIIDCDGNIKKRNKYIHRLVAQYFCPNPENLNEVNHINGLKYDNYYKNLEWVSKTANIRHAFQTGLNKGKTELTVEQMDMIRDMYMDEKFHQSSKLIFDAIDHNLYPHISLKIVIAIKYGTGVSDIYRKSNKYNIDEFLSKMQVRHPIDEMTKNEIIRLLKENNGNLHETFVVMKDIHPEVSYDMIKWYRSKM